MLTQAHQAFQVLRCCQSTSEQQASDHQMLQCIMAWNYSKISVLADASNRKQTVEKITHNAVQLPRCLHLLEATNEQHSRRRSSKQYEEAHTCIIFTNKSCSYKRSANMFRRFIHRPDTVSEFHVSTQVQQTRHSIDVSGLGCSKKLSFAVIVTSVDVVGRCCRRRHWELVFARRKSVLFCFVLGRKTKTRTKRDEKKEKSDKDKRFIWNKEINKKAYKNAEPRLCFGELLCGGARWLKNSSQSERKKCFCFCFCCVAIFDLIL